jgi:alanine racemase
MTTTSAEGGASRPTLRIDLEAVRANWRLFASLGPEAGATIKADAYGLGAARIGTALHAEGCRSFFVAQPQEGAQLRAALSEDATITVYNGPTSDTIDLFLANNLRPALNAPRQIDIWRSAGGGPCALHVDTGMNRLGLTAEEARQLAGSTHGLDLKLVMSHLASADLPDHEMNLRQLRLFQELAALFPGVPRSLANSAGALLGPDYQFELSRPGIGLYGGQPRSPGGAPIRPVATICAPIIATRRVSAGDTVGYGAAFTAPSTMTIAIIALGYADGLIRAASPGAYGIVAGKPAPLVGRISMDLTALDVTGLESHAIPGSYIEFLGESLDSFADAAGTISYEVLTRLGQRFARVYVE